jgi:hypothetical protein
MSSLAADSSASMLSSARPFPGLRPFEEPDSGWFFGRSSEINELLKRLRRLRFVAIVGPSGCGKSSLIRAGVLPSIRDGYLDSAWSICTFRPGEQPLDNLARAVSASISADFEGVRKLLDSSSMGLIKAIQAKQLPSDNKLLILVDQFEELFQFAQRHGDQSQEEVKAFLKLLLTAISSNDVPLYLVLTMRMEWLSECSTYVGLAESINEGIYLVPQMSRRQFQQVILNPIETAGGMITTIVLDRMLNDLAGRSDQLPVLQHALMRLWERRRPGEPMDIAGYEAIGTYSNCLSDHAEEVFIELNNQQKEIAELLFRSITQVYKNRKIRRPRPFGELASLPGMNAMELKSVIAAFGRQGRSFLFTSEGPLEPASVIDISHEALMRQWSRLAGWVEDEAELETRLVRLREDAAEWDRTGRKDRSALYIGYKLQKVEEVRPRLAESKTEVDFLQASRKAERWTKLWRRGALFLPLLLMIVAVLFWSLERAKQEARLAEAAEANAETLRITADKARHEAETALQQALRAQGEQATIRKEISSAAGSAQALAAIQKTLNAKRIYLQYVPDDEPSSSRISGANPKTDSGLALAKSVGANLKQAGYAVPGYEKVLPSKAPSNNQVRYFYSQDKPEADKVVGLLKQWVSGDVESVLVNNPNNVVPEGQFEIWIAAGTTPLIKADKVDKEFYTAKDRLTAIQAATIYVPRPVRNANILQGPSQDPKQFQFHPDDKMTCDFETPGSKMGGMTPQFNCKITRVESTNGQVQTLTADMDEEPLKVTFGASNNAIYAEVVSTRLMWALGFYADSWFPVQVVCNNCPADPESGAGATGVRTFDLATVVRKYPGRKMYEDGMSDQGWSWNEFDASNGRPKSEKDALKLLAAFIQHSDNKPPQQRLVCDNVKVDQSTNPFTTTCDNSKMIVQDLGATFGGGGLFTGNASAKMNLENWSEKKLWKMVGTPGTDEAKCPVCQAVLNKSLSATNGLSDPTISEEGRRMLAGLMCQLTDQQIQDLFKAAKVSTMPKYHNADGSFKQGLDAATIEKQWVEAFKAKREDMARGRCRWDNKPADLAPIDNPAGLASVPNNCSAPIH